MQYKVKMEQILGSPPENLWSAILPQILMWSFRRYFLKALEEPDKSLIDDTWTDFIDLIKRYAPESFKKDAINFMHPDVVDMVPMSLEALDTFLREIIELFDKALKTDDDDMIQELATFLDDEVPILIKEWLGDVYIPLYIFPETVEEEEDFTTERRQQFLQSVGHFILFGHLDKIGEVLPFNNIKKIPLLLKSAIRNRTIRLNVRRSITPIRGHHMKTKRVRFLQTPPVSDIK